MWTITQNSCDFCTNLWKLKFAQNLYEPMKLGKFVISLHCDLHLQIESFCAQHFIHVF
jgi:hypothetical protein